MKKAAPKCLDVKVWIALANGTTKKIARAQRATQSQARSFFTIVFRAIVSNSFKKWNIYPEVAYYYWMIIMGRFIEAGDTALNL